MPGSAWTWPAAPGAGEEAGVLLETPAYFCHPLLHCTLNLSSGNRDQVMENSRDEAEEGSERELPRGGCGTRGCRRGRRGHWPFGHGICVSLILGTVSSSVACVFKNHREMERVQKRATKMADKNAFVVQARISASAWV